MQQYNYEEEINEDLNQFQQLNQLQGSQILNIFATGGININYHDPITTQVGVLNIKRLFSYTDYTQLIDNIYIYRDQINNFKSEQNTHYQMNNQTQILRIHQLQHLPMFFRHEKWKFTLSNHMHFMEFNRCQYPPNYFFILAKQLINIIDSLHQNNISHHNITPDNIVIIRESQYKFKFLSEPNEQQYYSYILKEYQIDPDGTAEDLKTRIKQLKLDQETKQLFIEGKISPEMYIQSPFIQKIIDINRIAKQYNKDIRWVDFDYIYEYENDQVKLTNFSQQMLRNDVNLEDWRQHMIKDYQDLGDILYLVWAQTFQRKIHHNFASLKQNQIRQEIIQNLKQNDVYERILIGLLDGKNYMTAFQEIQQIQLQHQDEQYDYEFLLTMIIFIYISLQLYDLNILEFISIILFFVEFLKKFIFYTHFSNINLKLLQGIEILRNGSLRLKTTKWQMFDQNNQDLDFDK
ncbi:hypothetical protein pb186bvf_005290 [Paramecium bursaria]